MDNTTPVIPTVRSNENHRMSISAIFGTRLPVLHQTPPQVTGGSKEAPSKLSIGNGSGAGKLTTECSSRPQKKATAHHKKTRPRKTQPWDIKRGPTVYPPLPKLPPEWTFAPANVDEGAVASSSSSPALETAESAE